MKKYITGAVALAFLSMSGLVSAQGTTDTATTPSAETAKSTTLKAKHHHKHAHKASKQTKSETPKQ